MKNGLNPRLLNLVGTKYVVTAAQQTQLPVNLGERPVTSVASFGQLQVFRNDNAFPRAFLVDRYQVMPDRKDITAQVLTGTDDLRTKAFLEEEPGGGVSSGFAPGDSTWVVRHDIDSVVVGVRCATGKLLILTDTWYESWHPYIDGAPVKLLRADGAFRAVVVPPGEHTVLYKYQSSRYGTGRMVTWLTSLWVLGIIGWQFARNRRKDIPVEETDR